MCELPNLQLELPSGSRLQQVVQEKLKQRIPVFELLLAVKAIASGSWFAAWYLKLIERLRHWTIGIEDHPRWRQYWNDPIGSIREVVDLLLQGVCTADQLHQGISFLIDSAQEWDAMTVEQRKQALAEIPTEVLEQFLNESLAFLTENLKGAVVDAYWDQERFEPELAPDADILPLLFFARVYFPCMVRYGLRPDVVLGLAVEGDTQAIERVLELDPAAETFPEIARQKNAAIRNGDVSKAELFTKATFRMKPRSICGNSMKYLFASVVMHLVDVLSAIPLRTGRHVRKTDLHELYDALAIDRSGGNVLRDDELVDKSSFGREVNDWKRKVAAIGWDFFEITKIRVV